MSFKRFLKKAVFPTYEHCNMIYMALSIG